MVWQSYCKNKKSAIFFAPQCRNLHGLVQWFRQWTLKYETEVQFPLKPMTTRITGALLLQLFPLKPMTTRITGALLLQLKKNSI